MILEKKKKDETPHQEAPARVQERNFSTEKQDETNKNKENNKNK